MSTNQNINSDGDGTYGVVGITSCRAQHYR
jgi:hypothetical protein